MLLKHQLEWFPVFGLFLYNTPQYSAKYICFLVRPKSAPTREASILPEYFTRIFNACLT